MTGNTEIEPEFHQEPPAVLLAENNSPVILEGEAELLKIEKSKNDKDAASREETEETYRERKVYQPLRYLALPPLHEIERLTLADFDRLRAAVIADDTLTSLARSRHSASNSELIIRACHLLFALVEAGGLLAGKPERDILDLKINVLDARFGLLQLSRKSVVKNSENENSEIGNDESRAAAVASNANGIRQPLYTLGRLHLASFIRFRLMKQKARDGDRLLPEFEIARDELKTISAELSWLENISNKSNLTWQAIFRHWLQSQLGERGGKETVMWSNVAQIAAWRLIERERYPFLIAARRRRFQSVPLPDEKIASILEISPLRFTKTGHAPAIFATETGEMREVIGGSSATGSDESEDFEKEISGISPEGKDPLTGFGFVSRLLSQLIRSSLKEKTLIEHFKSQAERKEVKENTDLQNLLLWTAEILKDKKRISTAHTYAVRTLRALFSIPHIPFASWQTEDVAEYLENYSTNASIKNVRTALEQFDNYLVGEEKAVCGHINWRSRTLQSPVTYAARDVLSNHEYERVRKSVEEENEINPDENKKLADLALLTLLRRCGLRAGEVAHLTSANFTGFSKWCLNITKSKTRAGVRKLPLYLLLDAKELAELREFIELRKREAGAHGSLFADRQGVPLTAHKIGRGAEKLLRRGGVAGETSHGLRHAFASSLFASFWLNLTRHRRAETSASSAALRALKEYARPEIEGAAVPEPVYMQQLLGHADLRVTFERYIHLAELAGADAVFLSEQEK